MSDNNAPPMSQPGPFPIPSRQKRPRWVGIAVSVIIIIVVGVGVRFALNYSSNPPVNTADKATFQEYGITVQYPAGAKVDSKGLTGSVQNSGQGEVSWTWNGGLTIFGIGWLNTSQFYYTSTFAGIYQTLQQNSTETAITASGSTQLDGLQWPYQSYQFVSSGTTSYVTYALYFNQTESRLYLMFFGDAANTTLNSLDSWGSTFRG